MKMSIELFCTGEIVKLSNSLKVNCSVMNQIYLKYFVKHARYKNEAKKI